MRSSVFLLALAAVATARTDLQGCTSSDVVAYGGASVLWYVPGTGEICSFLDCGGGMAPPMTTVPGCPLYSGTATVTPSFLAGFEDGSGSGSGSAAVSSSIASAAASTTFGSFVTITGSTITGAPSQTTLTGAAKTSSTVSSEGVSTSLVTSTGTASESKSTSSTGTRSSGSLASGSGSSTSTAASSSNTSNAGVTVSTNLVAPVIIGAAMAGLAFLL